MSRTRAYAALAPNTALRPFEIDRRAPGPRDVAIEVEWSGICHSDIHQVRAEWERGAFPMVPGHEIVGRVTRVGGEVTKFRVGDRVGVGCMVDACRTCRACSRGTEQFCAKGAAFTYNSTEMDRATPTYGGYATDIVVDEAFVLAIPAGLDAAGAAPLLCAGITTYSPLRHWKVKQGDRVGVVGLGGLGHLAVKLAAAMGAEVTMLSTSKAKEADARRLGAAEFGLTSDPATFARLRGRFDLVVDTISAPHDLEAYLGMVAIDGTLVLLGVPPEPARVGAGSLIFGRKSLAGSLIGGIAETQEMLEFCGRHGITADVEVIPIEGVNEAYDRAVASDVRYRFVIDVATLRAVG